jgi:hypothetical protein
MDTDTQGAPQDRLLIEGRTEDDKKFRPSDWAERISSLLASFGADHRLRYSAHVQPCLIQGEQCLIVARDLETAHPEVFGFIIEFARSNHLRIQIDRRVRQEAVVVERRDTDREYVDLEEQKRAG